MNFQISDENLLVMLIVAWSYSLIYYVQDLLTYSPPLIYLLVFTFPSEKYIYGSFNMENGKGAPSMSRRKTRRCFETHHLLLMGL
jgi:hypothetical protein